MRMALVCGLQGGFDPGLGLKTAPRVGQKHAHLLGCLMIKTTVARGSALDVSHRPPRDDLRLGVGRPVLGVSHQGFLPSARFLDQFAARWVPTAGVCVGQLQDQDRRNREPNRGRERRHPGRGRCGPKCVASAALVRPSGSSVRPSDLGSPLRAVPTACKQ